MKTKSKLLTIAVMLVILLLLSGAGAFRADPAQLKGTGIYSPDDLTGKRLCGVKGRMPATSAKIFFESVIGRKLASYTDYSSMDECITALKTGKADAIWTTDVTADYLAASDETLSVIPTNDMADIENTEEPRFYFGMALKNDEAGEALCGELNQALVYLKTAGRIDELAAKYLSPDAEAEEFTADDMLSASDEYKKYYKGDPIVIGVTGATPPVDMLNRRSEPVGFAPALLDEMARTMQRRIEILVVDNETVFSDLMSGRIDAVFCYGAGKITTEGSKKWIMTDGYYPMMRYEFVTYLGN